MRAGVEDVAITYTITSLAEQWGIAAVTLRRTIETMRSAGKTVRVQKGSTYPILLTETDATNIAQWRADHPLGRSKAEAS